MKTRTQVSSKEVARALLLAILAAELSACGVSAPPPPWQDGMISINADKEGMRAFGDVLNGMITNGKETPDHESAHWTTRKVQEAVRPGVQQGFIQRLLGGTQAQSPTPAKEGSGS